VKERPTLQLRETSICVRFPTKIEVKRGGTAGKGGKACALEWTWSPREREVEGVCKT
jgi:hypothetical protein